MDLNSHFNILDNTSKAKVLIYKLDRILGKKGFWHWEGLILNKGDSCRINDNGEIKTLILNQEKIIKVKFGDRDFISLIDSIISLADFEFINKNIVFKITEIQVIEKKIIIKIVYENIINAICGEAYFKKGIKGRSLELSARLPETID